MNTLYFGDNLDWLPKIDAGSVDLVYDPPLAAALNDRGVRTARGARWHVSNVKNLIDRCGA
jgi:hypothetical protein